MKIRLITGASYIAVLALFFTLKIFVHDLFFDALVYLFALIGTFEMTRAMKDKITKAEKILVFVFSAVCIPACAIFESFGWLGLDGKRVTAICFFVFVVAVLCLLVAKHDETTPENLGVTLLSACYPTLLLCLLIVCNHFTDTLATEPYKINGDLAILFMFVISPFADSLAYVFGRFLKGKFPKKLAPVVSPNKTVIGGIGGLVGGLVGATILYFAYSGVIGNFDQTALWLPVYLTIGLVCAVATAWGDLVESCVKRKVEIKDMGNLLPGHGGILDRIDGTLFACIVVYVAFEILYAVL